jgi:hypothetical protein
MVFGERLHATARSRTTTSSTYKRTNDYFLYVDYKRTTTLPTTGLHCDRYSLKQMFMFISCIIMNIIGVLDQQTYQGGTGGSRLCGEDCDRETENSKVCARRRDTIFIQVRVAKVANPTSCLGIKYGALRLVLVEIRCPARYPALLYIVQGAGS